MAEVFGLGQQPDVWKNVSLVFSAGFSSEQMIRTAALILPPSILDMTAIEYKRKYALERDER